MRSCSELGHCPAIWLVVTTTLHCSKKESRSDLFVGLLKSAPTIGNCAPLSSTPSNERSIPKVRNLSVNWLRSASVGTMTRTFGHGVDTGSAIMVSVLPVPVCMTMVAVSAETVQCAWIACTAPIWGGRSPFIPTDSSSSTYLNAPDHDSRIDRRASALFSRDDRRFWVDELDSG